MRTGTAALGNGSEGIEVENASGNPIGGRLDGGTAT